MTSSSSEEDTVNISMEDVVATETGNISGADHTAETDNATAADKADDTGKKNEADVKEEDDEDDIEDDDEWTTGDFELISADMVRFRVPSYYLFAASAVFRAAHGLDNGSERKITFTDESYETADVLRLFLDLIAHGTTRPKSSSKKYKDLANFLVKWDCDQPLDYMCALLENSLASELVVDKNGGRTAPNPLHGTPTQNIWDPAHWEIWLWNSDIPQQYLFAVARAFGNRTTNGLANEFKRFLQLFQEGSSAKAPSAQDTSDDTITDDDTWLDGDFEIITADHVRLRVPSYYLFASSKVIRDSYSGSSSRKIILTDRRFETAIVVRLYLQLISRGFLILRQNLSTMKNLANFLNKWDCEAPLNTLCCILETSVRSGEVSSATGAFEVAASAGNDVLCSTILKLLAGHTWSMPKDDQVPDPIKGTPGKSCWDPSHWCVDFWMSGIPQKYLFALARAYGHGDKAVLATEFKRYLGAAEAKEK